MRADYQCNKCSKVVEYIKPYGKDFPEQISKSDLGSDSELECSESNCSLKRLYNYVPVIDVALGLTGNASTGYSGENVYKSSSYSPNRLNDYPTRHKFQHSEQ